MPTLRKNTSSGFFFLDYYNAAGQRIRVSLRTKDKNLARARFRQKIADLQIKEEYPIAYISDFFDEYKAHFHLTGKKAVTTIDVEVNVMRKFLRLCPVKLLTDLTPKNMDVVFRDIAEGVKPETVNMYRRTLHSIFQRAVKWEMIEKNPVRTVDKLTWQEPMPRVLKPAELVKFFKKVAEFIPELGAYYQFLLLTGVRRSEALNLQWSEVNLSEGLIELNKTKSKKSRYVLITPRLGAILESRRALPQPFPYGRAQVSRWFRRCALGAGLANCKLHDLRKTFSSYIQMAGMPSNIVSIMIGHSQEDVTRRYYTGTYAEMLQPIYTRFENNIQSALPNIA